MDASTFHTTIITEFALGGLSPEEQMTYIDQIGELVVQGVLIKSLSALDTGHAAQLETLIDEGKSQDEILQFLHSAIPGFNQLITDEIQSVKMDLQTGIGKGTV